MRAIVGCGALLVFCLSAAAQTGEDQKRIQGTWKVITAEYNGKKASADEIDGMRLIIADDSIQVKVKNKDQDRYTFKLMPKEKPKQIDLTHTGGDKKGQVDRGIYQFLGERLTLCIQENKEVVRPRDFATEPDSSLFLVVLERVK